MRLSHPSRAITEMTSTDAVRRFLDHMTIRIEDPFEDFTHRLKAALEESDLPLEERYTFFDRKDLSALFLTHAVAMEACLVRTVFDVTTSDAVLAELAEQLDELVFSDGSAPPEPLSSAFWDVLARVQVCTIDETKKPHDIALKYLLGVLELRRKETHAVLRDFVVRQSLSECLARCTQFWWINLSQNAEITPVEQTDLDDHPEDSQPLSARPPELYRLNG